MLRSVLYRAFVYGMIMSSGPDLRVLLFILNAATTRTAHLARLQVSLIFILQHNMRWYHPRILARKSLQPFLQFTSGGLGYADKPSSSFGAGRSVWMVFWWVAWTWHFLFSASSFSSSSLPLSTCKYQRGNDGWTKGVNQYGIIGRHGESNTSYYVLSLLEERERWEAPPQHPPKPTDTIQKVAAKTVHYRFLAVKVITILLSFYAMSWWMSCYMLGVECQGC